MEKKAGNHLVQKLAKIMADVQWVEKRGRNAFFNYEYARETDILDSVRTKLAESNVFVFTSIEQTEQRETGKRTRDGSPVTLVFVRTKHTFWDGDTGETVEVFGSGCGEDAGDKAIYKAITGAMKYFISKNFLISTGDDPEKDSESDKAERGSTKGESSHLDATSETTSMTPEPIFEAPSSTPSPLSPSLNENPFRDLVLDIQSKTGPKRDGSLYTRHTIQTRNHGYLTTFNAAFADLAHDAKNSHEEVVIRYKANGRWRDIVSLRYADTEREISAPAYSEADALPF